MHTRKQPDVTRLERVVDRLSAVIYEFVVRPDGSSGFAYISSYCQEMLGLSPAEIMAAGYDFRQWVVEEDRDSFNRTLEEAIIHRREFYWKGRARVGEKVIWISANSVPTIEPDGTVIFDGIFQDITNQVKTESDRSEFEFRLRGLVERLPLAIAIHQNGRLVSVNAYAATMLGYADPKEMIGQEVLKFVHPDDHEKVRYRAQQALSGSVLDPLEERFLLPDGTGVAVETIAFPMVYDGRPAVQIIARDLREEKAREAEQKKIETLFFELFQHSPMSVVMLDEKGNVVRVNRGFEETFGYAQSELVGLSLNQFIVPQELEAEGNDLNSLISSANVVRIETIRLKKDGSPLSTIVYGVPVHMEDRTIGIFGVYVDITERKKVEEELKVRNAELDNFVYKVSHDLRAPLSSILGLVQLANMKGNDDNLREYLKIVGKKVSELDHFISDVLSHSKNLKQDVRISRIDFRDLMEATLSNLSYMKDASKVRSSIQISGSEFYSDRWRIAEIFRNLISNAIKYRQQDIDGSYFRIHIEVSDETARIAFEDNGMGISEDSLSRIFEMFYRASETSDGSGLGLYIVRNAVDKLGGTIEVSSQLSVGTRFAISLPNQKTASSGQQQL